MRRIFGWVALLIGAFLLVTSFLMLVVAPPKAQRVPLDVKNWTYLTGNAKHLNPKTGKTVEDPVVVSSLTKVDPKVSTDKYVAWVTTTCVNANVDNPPKCLPKTDSRLITNSVSVFASDRHTGMATTKLDLGSKATKPAPKGLVNKFGFNTAKKTYPYWNDMLAKTVPAEYVGTKTFDGVQTYAFKVTVPPTPAEVVDGIKGVYSFENTLWIEPKTGSIIDQVQKQKRTLKDGTVVLDMTVRYTGPQIKVNVSDAKANIKNLSLFSGWIPWAVGAAGLLFLLVGLVLVIGGRKKKTA